MGIKDFLQSSVGGFTRRPAPPGSTEGWLPIADIRHGMIATQDMRFVKVLEILPVNFYLKSQAEQRNIIYYFAAWLKTAPDGIQITAITQKANIDSFVTRMHDRQQQEESERCRAMIEDIIQEVKYLAEREAVTRRFFLSFQFEPHMKTRSNSIEAIAERLNEEADTARRFLEQCGLEIIEPRYSDNALCELLYAMVNKQTSQVVKLPETIFTMAGQVHGVEEVT